MIWSDFKTAVIEELGVDGNRRGIDALRTRSMRDAVVDLQRYIRAFRTGQTSVYNVADLTAVDWAHLGTLPAQAKPKAFYIVSEVPNPDASLPDPNCARNRLDFFPWQDRQHMICDKWGVRRYQYAISPYSTEFLVHPLVNDETYLLVVWDGIKMTFADGDTVPWPEQAAEAVAAYVKWKILLEVDKRLDLAREWYDKGKSLGIYPNLRLALWREQNESQQADGKDEEYAAGSPTPPGFRGSQAGSVSLAINDASKVIVFPLAFSAPPIVSCWVVPPDNTGFVISADPDGSTITATGFTALFGAAVPAAGYKLYWSAQPAS